MVEVEPTPASDAPELPAHDAPETAPVAAPPDWSDVRGFQVLATSSAAPVADPEARAIELGKELAARSARFAQSVDDSVVLASDGIIRWLGDPIARLVGGDDILKPRGVLLADDALSGESREAVERRLALWIAAHVRKVLGPLEALAEPDAVSEHARDLAQRIVQALGVLERERVRQQVKNLDQNARSTLRKLGVRFGSLYIYAPALLKPGPRTLCSQLWSLRRGVEPGAERLLAFAASGRTSFAAEAPLSSDTYRVAGFRLCGDRVVRVDIVERLTDLIRAAIPDHMRPGGRTPPEAYGFVVSPQMTSLTGCAGDSFASILRSLGFESHRVTRAAYEAATRKAATQPIAPPAEAPAAAVEAPPDNAAVEGETRDVSDGSPEQGPVEIEPIEAAESAPQAAATEPESTAVSDDRGEESEPTEVVEPASIEAELVGDTEGPRESDPIDAESTEVAALAPEADAVSAGPLEAEPIYENAAVAEVPEGEIAEATATLEAVGEVATATPEPAEAETSPTAVAGQEPVAPGAAPAAEEEWIEIWRPAPRRRPQPAARPAEAESVQRPRHPRRNSQRRDRNSTSAPTPAAAVVAAAPEAVSPEPPRRSEGGRHERGEGRRPHRFKGSRSDEGRSAEAPRPPVEPIRPPPKKEPRPQTVDMDSPFAKLLALKPLLERRDKRN